MLSILTLAVLFHLVPPVQAEAPATVVASPDPCIPKDPDKDYRKFISPEWDPTCYSTYNTTFLLARATYWDTIGMCAPLDCACYAAAWKEFLRIMEQAENYLRHCSPT